MTPFENITPQPNRGKGRILSLAQKDMCEHIALIVSMSHLQTWLEDENILAYYDEAGDVVRVTNSSLEDTRIGRRSSDSSSSSRSFSSSFLHAFCSKWIVLDDFPVVNVDCSIYTCCVAIGGHLFNSIPCFVFSFLN